MVTCLFLHVNIELISGNELFKNLDVFRFSFFLI